MTAEERKAIGQSIEYTRVCLDEIKPAIEFHINALAALEELLERDPAVTPPPEEEEDE